ncbi:MAG TPA: NAD(P)/FAD-dependent oxidoreductase [Acidimicrobiales bacterium]|nr:NAD(P)/FAD-dependent oxidoreductase [Acidimicrobiales bacterium]
MHPSPRPRVLVLGSGFGGLNAALHLARAPVEVTVVDRDNYHGFWPLLYQVATAGLGPDDIAHPLRAIYARHDNIRVRRGNVTAIDLEARRVDLDGGEQVEYEYLIVALGSAANDFGIPGVDEHTFPLKTLPDAVRLRNHVLGLFEAVDAASESEPAAPVLPTGEGGEAGSADAGGGGEAGDEASLTFVLAGGGSTGVEMAGALAELIGHTLARDYRHLDLSRARIVLVEATDRLLAGFPRKAHDEALATLRNKGVEVLLGTALSAVDESSVRLADGTVIPTRTVVWTAGVRAAPVLASLAVPMGRSGTVKVGPDLRLDGHPEVFVIGDAAASSTRDGSQLPMLAQVAIQGGRHAATSIERVLLGKQPTTFRYHNHGIMATIGRRSAVAELPGGIFFGGSIGWFAWLGVHLVFLIGFRNRAVVLLNWAWNYLTWDRGSRVILEPD